MKRITHAALLAGGLATALGVAGCSATPAKPVNVSATDVNATQQAADPNSGAGGAAMNGMPGMNGAGGGADTASAAPQAPADPPTLAAPPAAAAAGANELVKATLAKMGSVVTSNGWVLYRFDKDSANPPTSNCSGTCAKVWPPVLTTGSPRLVGVDPQLVNMINRSDGGMQVTLNGWPLYRYAGDKEKGQWKGQGVSGTWWVSDPNGKKNLTCVPKGIPTPVAPPADQAGSGGGMQMPGGATMPMPSDGNSGGYGS